ncbi:MAG: hypothetical protein EP344_16015 [Bacteroidetes bacterium]|nr:MAG: hypothetical protein EP344_16015 [Bacteroidota bacterium]
MKDIDTETLLEAAGETAEYAKQYAKLQLDYFRLETAEAVAKATSSLVATLAVAILGLVALIMLTVAAGFYLGQLWDNYPLAFTCVSGFYVLLAGLVLIFKDRWVTNPLLTNLIRSLFN